MDVFGLRGRPVGAAVTEERSLQERIDDRGPAVEKADPRKVGKAVGKPLRFRRIVDAREGVVVLDESHPPSGRLSRQPGVAVDVHLHREREPGLNADVHEPEVTVEVVEVENPLRPPRMHQHRPSLRMHQPDRLARLLDAEDVTPA